MKGAARSTASRHFSAAASRSSGWTASLHPSPAHFRGGLTRKRHPFRLRLDVQSGRRTTPGHRARRLHERAVTQFAHAQGRFGAFSFRDVAHDAAHSDNTAISVEEGPGSQTYGKNGPILADIFLFIFFRFATRQNAPARSSPPSHAIWRA